MRRARGAVEMVLCRSNIVTSQLSTEAIKGGRHVCQRLKKRERGRERFLSPPFPSPPPFHKCSTPVLHSQPEILILSVLSIQAIDTLQHRPVQHTLPFICAGFRSSCWLHPRSPKLSSRQLTCPASTLALRVFPQHLILIFQRHSCQPWRGCG